MSKGTARTKMNIKRESSSNNDRLSDDDNNRRRPKNAGMNDLRKTQIGVLQSILSNQRNANRVASKNPTTRNGTVPKPRPASAKNPTLSYWDRSNEVTDRGTRSTKKDESPNRITRSHSRPHTNVSRSLTNVSIVSDKSNPDPSSDQFKKLLVRLSSELNNLQSITGFKPIKSDLFSCSSSAALATALIGLVGHVKQCGSNTKEIHQLKEQLSIFAQSQLDFQQRMETQLATLQTMMQTICQVVNNDMLSNRRPPADLHISQSNPNWLTNAQRPYLVEKDTDNTMHELLTFTRRINNGEIFSTSDHSASSIETNRHSNYLETLETSKKLTRPTSAISTDGNETKSIRRSSMISPLDATAASPTETILEKILQERLRLVQQMNELNKQHEMTQEELANLEGRTVQTS